MEQNTRYLFSVLLPPLHNILVNLRAMLLGLYTLIRDTSDLRRKVRPRLIPKHYKMYMIYPSHLRLLEPISRVRSEWWCVQASQIMLKSSMPTCGLPPVRGMVWIKCIARLVSNPVMDRFRYYTRPFWWP